MTSFDKLSDVHVVARERAREDFAYFANHVMGAGLPDEACVVVQKCIERGSVSSIIQFDLPKHKLNALQNAAHGWASLIERDLPTDYSFQPSSTYVWLFGEAA
jgi:hypothetical protein